MQALLGLAQGDPLSSAESHTAVSYITCVGSPQALDAVPVGMHPRAGPLPPVPDHGSVSVDAPCLFSLLVSWMFSCGRIAAAAQTVQNPAGLGFGTQVPCAFCLHPLRRPTLLVLPPPRLGALQVAETPKSRVTRSGTRGTHWGAWAGRRCPWRDARSEAFIPRESGLCRQHEAPSCPGQTRPGLGSSCGKN